MPRINSIIRKGSQSGVDEEDFILREIREFRASQKYADMLKGEDYYLGRHDILQRKRTAIGENGDLTTVANLPNNRVVDNQYGKLVMQRVNYLLGQPVVFRCENHEYMAMVQKILGKSFHSVLKEVCTDALNCGIGWLFMHYDGEGSLRFKRFHPYQIIPGWADEERTVLDYVIRFYDSVVVESKGRKCITKVEMYDSRGIRRYYIDDGRLVKDGKDWKTPYFYGKGCELLWDSLPFAAFRCNDWEQPLLKSVKSLQDGLNLLLSNFQNNMEEDVRNTILVLKNYDGENLGEFRQNLSTYGAVKVRSVDGSQGGVETLNIQVSSENYKAVIELFKKAIIENGRGYDAKDDRLGGNANQLNILSMYSDIDLAANDMECSFQAALDRVLYFVGLHIANMGMGDYSNENMEVIFNRDILISESEAIDNCIKSLSVLSLETVVAQHPWVDNVKKELERKKSEERSQVDKPQNNTDNNDSGNNNTAEENDNKNEVSK